MDSLSNGSKRKKRKTRKCLDELRKRSRHVNDVIEKQSPITNTVNKMGKRSTTLMEIKPTNITTNRLTLAMFPKVIRSETITRPLPEIIENPGRSYPHLVKENSITETYEIPQQSNSDSDFIENSDVEFINNRASREGSHETRSVSLQRDDESVNMSTQNNSPDSIVVLSPVDRTEDSDSLAVSVSGTSASSSSSHSSRVGYGNQLYEEFMNEMPMYLRQAIPSFLKNDVLKKSKTHLHKMYIEGCRRECEDNVLQCMRNGALRNQCVTPPEPPSPPSQTPLEYLRITHTAHKRLRSPPEHTLHETPEYTYYPHKLNH